MAEIKLDNISLTYPLLGGGVRRKVKDEGLAGAGSIVKDKKRYSRSVVALKNISAHLSDGDRVGLIGHNGSGKSTLLRVMAGIYEPNVGRVSITGDIAALFSAGVGIKNDATGRRNIELAGIMAGLSKSAQVDLVKSVADFTELGQYLDMPVRTYSNGMAMRLKFACATAFSPEIMLIDEWLGAGDITFQKKALQRVNERVQTAGIMVLASHQTKLIQNECNKAIWLDGGVMRRMGPTKEVVAEMLDFAKAKKT